MTPAKSGITLGASILDLCAVVKNSGFVVYVTCYTYCCFFSFYFLIASMFVTVSDIDDVVKHRHSTTKKMVYRLGSPNLYRFGDGGSPKSGVPIST